MSVWQATQIQESYQPSNLKAGAVVCAGQEASLLVVTAAAAVGRKCSKRTNGGFCPLRRSDLVGALTRLFVVCFPYSSRLKLRSVNGSPTHGAGPPVWAYFDCLDQGLGIESKALLQSLERKHLTMRTRIKRLARKTICFSKSVLIHDTVIGLFIDQFFFGIQHY